MENELIITTMKTNLITVVQVNVVLTERLVQTINCMEKLQSSSHTQNDGENRNINAKGDYCWDSIVIIMTSY
jgi:hypothetical protein